MNYRPELSQAPNPYRYLWRTWFLRPFCIPRRHKYWNRDTLLTALASGRSKRCHWCNRLVVKRKFRRYYQ